MLILRIVRRHFGAIQAPAALVRNEHDLGGLKSLFVEDDPVIAIKNIRARWAISRHSVYRAAVAAQVGDKGPDFLAVEISLRPFFAKKTKGSCPQELDFVRWQIADWRVRGAASKKGWNKGKHQSKTSFDHAVKILSYQDAQRRARLLRTQEA